MDSFFTDDMWTGVVTESVARLGGTSLAADVFAQAGTIDRFTMHGAPNSHVGGNVHPVNENAGNSVLVRYCPYLHASLASSNSFGGLKNRSGETRGLLVGHRIQQELDTFGARDRL